MKLHIDDIRLRLAENTFYFNVDVKDGITGIFGLSGAGKTTLMKIIAGIQNADSGRLTFNERVLFDKQKKINVPPNKRNMGVVFQESFLFPNLTVEKNLRYSEPYTKKQKKVIDFDSVIELLDIQNLLSKMPAQLSGGERQRSAIGRALLSQPRMLLMDEPFSNLDRDRRRQIISYLLEINRRFEIPLLIISHDLEDILKLTRSFIIIEQGSIRTAGNYLDIADSGTAPELISHKRFINVVELIHAEYKEEESLNCFSPDGNPANTVLTANSEYFADPLVRGRKVRLCIFPDDIALSKKPILDISIQNQLKGKITAFRGGSSSCFVSIDCGVELTAEITRQSQKEMRLEVGQDIYCLIKAKAVEIVHIYGE
jgi:molybdate transport system ATP-binding protein